MTTILAHYYPDSTVVSVWYVFDRNNDQHDYQESVKVEQQIRDFFVAFFHDDVLVGIDQPDQEDYCSTYVYQNLYDKDRYRFGFTKMVVLPRIHFTVQIHNSYVE